MTQEGRRRLRNGREVPVHDNDGLRKICGCPRRLWAKCKHSWHFAYCWKGRHYRFSLDRYANKHVEGKTEATDLAERLRAKIRDGTFASIEEPPVNSPAATSVAGVTFEAFGEIFLERYSKARDKTSWADDASMLRHVMAFPVNWPGARTLGKKPLAAIVDDDIEVFIRHVAGTRRASTLNHYIQLVRSLNRWAVRRGYRERPFLAAESDVIRRRKVAKRNRRTGSSQSRIVSRRYSTTCGTTRTARSMVRWPTCSATNSGDASSASAGPGRQPC
jgi:hypothetical protein